MARAARDEEGGRGGDGNTMNKFARVEKWEAGGDCCHGASPKSVEQAMGASALQPTRFACGCAATAFRVREDDHDAETRVGDGLGLNGWIVIRVWTGLKMLEWALDCPLSLKS